MKLLALTVLAAMMIGLSGCTLDTPGYSANERFAQIGRNWNYEEKQANDDIDHALLLRPASRMTVWNVFHRN